MKFETDSNLFAYNKFYKPFYHSWAVDLTVEHERMHWIEEEIELMDDIQDWKTGKLTPSEKNFITQILRLFTQSDVNVGQFYLDLLIPTFKNNEVRNMLSSFATREGIHQRAYALLNDTLGLPESEYAAFLEYEEMADKAEFMMDANPDTKEGLGLTLAKSVFNEGVSLFASFVMLLSFQRRGLMIGMGKVVEWSTKDETKHVEGIAKLFRTYCEDHPEIVTDEFKKNIYDMARTAVSLEEKFIDLAYEMGEIEGLKAQDVKDYIRYITDRRLVQLGLKPNWDIEENPLDWVDWVLNGADHTNFFENKVADYEVGSIIGEWDYFEIKEFKIYSKEDCPFCERAKNLIVEKNHIYDEIDLTDNEKRQAFYKENGFLENNQNTVPKIYEIKDGKEIYIGGYTELHDYLAYTSYLNHQKIEEQKED